MWISVWDLVRSCIPFSKFEIINLFPQKVIWRCSRIYPFSSSFSPVPEQIEIKNSLTYTVDSPYANQRTVGEMQVQTARDSYKKPPFVHRETAKKQKIFPTFPPRSSTGKRLYTEQDLFLWAIFLNRIDLAKVSLLQKKWNFRSIGISYYLYRHKQ